MSEQHAEGIRPILRWIAKDGPRKREREDAKSLLKQTQGIVKWKQILITRSQLRMLSVIHEAFPEGAAPDKGKQLELFHTSPIEYTGTLPLMEPHRRIKPGDIVKEEEED